MAAVEAALKDNPNLSDADAAAAIALAVTTLCPEFQADAESALDQEAMAAYLAALDERGVAGNADALIAHGRAACKTLVASGNPADTVNEVVEQLMDEGLTATDAGAVIGLAVVFICPAVRPDLDSTP